LATQADHPEAGGNPYVVAEDELQAKLKKQDATTLSTNA
jgi:hypothetical protein